MDIKATLKEEHSRQQSFKVVHYIGSNVNRFDELLELMLGIDKVLAQRAAWVFKFVIQEQPSLLERRLKDVVTNLTKEIHIGVKRNTLRVLEEVDIPEDLMGIVATVCFDTLANHQGTIACKAHSMTILYNLCLKEPDLSDELRILIEEQLPYGSAGFKSRGNRILKKLRKLKH